MKKLLIVILFTFLLTSCFSKYNFDLEKEDSDITSVEIIEIIPNNTLDFQVIRVIDDESELELFIQDFSKLIYKKLIGDPESLEGISFKLNFENDFYYIFSERNIKRFNSNDEEISMLNMYCSKNKFKNIIDKYAY